MGGFADQRDAVAGEVRGSLDRQRKQVAPGFDLDAAENRMRLPFGGLRQLIVGERISRSASLGAVTQTTLQRSPGSGTKTHGPCGV